MFGFPAIMPTNPFVLDNLSAGVPAVAYSLRRLTESYMGKAINVRRSSDNATMDIGFNQYGTLDTTTLLSFIGSNSGYVVKWYNQGTLGSSGDASNGTNTAQPQIVASGVVETFNGQPALYWPTTTSRLFTGSITVVGNTGNWTANIVAAPTAINTIGISQGGSQYYFLLGLSNGTNTTSFAKAYNTSNSAYVTSGAISNIITAMVSGQILSQYGNGNSQGTATISGTPAPGGPVAIQIGESNVFGYNASGTTSETMVWNAALSDSDRMILEDNQAQFYSVNVIPRVFESLSAVPTVGYSLRQLTQKYYGKAVNVRRSSDNATKDIGFMGGQLDTATLLGFTGNANAYVTTWYNQGSLGSTGDVIQASTTLQPQIVASGALFKFNGLPTTMWSTDRLGTSTTIQLVNSSTGAWVANCVSNYTGSAAGFVMAQDSTNRVFRVGYESSGKAGATAANTSGTLFDSQSTETVPPAENILTGVMTGSNVTLFSNSRSEATTAVTGNAQTASETFYIGYDNKSGSYYTGSVSEVVIGLASTDRQTLEYSQLVYYGLPSQVIDRLSSKPTVAYSIRKLSGSYAGMCFNIRRDSDNATMDIGFVGNTLDTTTLTQFVGSANGYITKWYNQGSLGSSGDIINATNTAQPLIVSNGTITTFNNMPSLTFSGAQSLQTSGNVQAVASNGMWSANAVANVIATANTQSIIAQDVAGTRVFGMRYSNTPKFNAIAFSSGGGNNFVSSSTFSAPENVVTAIQNNSYFTTFSNGRTAGNTAVTASTMAGNTAVLSVGFDSAASLVYNGTISETLVFSAAISTIDRQTIEHDQESFYNVSGS